MRCPVQAAMLRLHPLWKERTVSHVETWIPKEKPEHVLSLSTSCTKASLALSTSVNCRGESLARINAKAIPGSYALLFLLCLKVCHDCAKNHKCGLRFVGGRPRRSRGQGAEPRSPLCSWKGVILPIAREPALEAGVLLSLDLNDDHFPCGVDWLAVHLFVSRKGARRCVSTSSLFISLSDKLGVVSVSHSRKKSRSSASRVANRWRTGQNEWRA